MSAAKRRDGHRSPPNRGAATDGRSGVRRARALAANARNARQGARATRAQLSARVVRVGLVQMRCVADPDANLARAERHVRAAARRGATIVCLPELFRSLYFCQSEDHDNFALAEAIPGPTTRALGALAKSLAIVIVASVFERRAAGVYHNTA